jgi:hypothetical protein
MAVKAVEDRRVSIAMACRTFEISETCYRYERLLSDENAEIADWLVWTCHSFVPVPCSVVMQLFVRKPVGFSNLMLSGDDVDCKIH